MPPNTVKVDRTTRYGNPFIVGKHGTRERCVQLFRHMLAGYICVSFRDLAAEQVAYREYLKSNVRGLKGKNLACWCSLDAPCHADILLEIANGR